MFGLVVRMEVSFLMMSMPMLLPRAFFGPKCLRGDLLSQMLLCMLGSVSVRIRVMGTFFESLA